MGDVVKLTFGRRARGRKLPKPVDCMKCEEPIETARLQVMPGARRCVSCQSAWDRNFNRAMEGIREHQAVEIIR